MLSVGTLAPNLARASLSPNPDQVPHGLSSRLTTHDDTLR